MKKIDLNKFENDSALLEHLRNLPKYKNTPLKSLFWKATFFLHLCYRRLFNINKPIFIVFVTNNKCNLDCTYCYGDYGKKGHYEEYTTRQLIQYADDLKDLGVKTLTIHGGESLLRNDIGEFLNYLKLRGFYVSLNTNGYAVPQKLEAIRNVDAFCISLDGTEENNDKYRGTGCFKKAIKAIDVLRENGLPIIVSATITKDTINDIEYILKLGKEKNFRVQFHILYNYKDQDQQEHRLSSEDIKNMIQKMLKMKQEGYPVYYNSENVLNAVTDWPLEFDRRVLLDTDEDYLELTKKHDMISCYHGSLKFQIDADGRVVVCWAWNNADAPNIKTLGIKEAFRQVQEKNHCRHCVFFANNAQNALMELRPKDILNNFAIQFNDALKMGSKKIPHKAMPGKSPDTCINSQQTHD